jgi:steroid 5-alpha reductase family enzyme
MGRRVLIGVMGGVWGARLAWHVLGRVAGGKEEDGRYQLLRTHFGARINLFHFFFFQAQAVSVAVLCGGFLVAAGDGRPFPGVLDVLGAIVWLIGMTGETIADRQLHAFKKDPASRGRTCRRGLWRYSRHPNYFFEWTMWVGYALVASGAEGWWGVWGWASAALMLLLVTKVTGIPPTEKRACKSRGEDYRAYQRTTSAFVPWFPKRSER